MGFWLTANFTNSYQSSRNVGWFHYFVNTQGSYGLTCDMTVFKCVDLSVNRTSLYLETPGCFNEKPFTSSSKYIASLVTR